MNGILQSVKHFLAEAPRRRVLVVGDVMLDAYISGEATRISPEAPVPVVAVSSRRHLAGGAANVAANIHSLGAASQLVGVTGADSSADFLQRELERIGLTGIALIRDPDRVTTTKTRITASGQQIVRFDDENLAPLNAVVDSRLRKVCEDCLPSADACVISDYAKGVASEAFCRWLIAAANAAGKPVVIDPKSPDLSRYRGAAVITPNLRETAIASGESIRNARELISAAGRILPGITPSALLVTQGGEGMSLFAGDAEPFRIPALPVEVADVTGAGDTVVAVLAIALAMGLDLREAAILANLAAGVAVRHTGTWAVHKEELLADSERIHQT